jgi:hypothetical protein
MVEFPIGSPSGSASSGPLAPSATSAALDSLGPPASAPVLPAELSDKAWAYIDPRTGRLTAGFLGQRASVSRELGRDTAAEASVVGPLLRLDDMREVEIIDVASGETLGRLGLDELAEPGHDSFAYPVEHLRIDPVHRLAYYLSSGVTGVVLRRFQFDGSDGIALATLAPDPAAEAWRGGVGFAVNPDGLVVAVSCSPESSKLRPDHRCRVYRIPPDAAGPVQPTILPARTPIPCLFIGAGRRYLLATTDPGHCLDDAVGPPRLPTDSFVTLALDDLTVHVTARDELAPDLDWFGLVEVGATPWLLGTYRQSYLYPNAYWPYSQGMKVDLSTNGGPLSAELLVPWDADPGPPVNAILQTYGDWLLMQPVGPGYAACRLNDPLEEASCPLEPAFLFHPADRERIPLQPGTYGPDTARWSPVW